MKIRDQKGAILALVLICFVVYSIIGSGLLYVSGAGAMEVARKSQAYQSFWIAEAGAAKAVYGVTALSKKSGKCPNAGALAAIALPAFDGFTFNEFKAELSGSPYSTIIANGAFKGLRGVVQDIDITVSASPANAAFIKKKIVQTIEHQSIFIFQFGVFYAQDLEILPGPSMTFFGPVHCNGDIYVACDESLRFDSLVTAAGNIYHDRKDNPGTASEGGVFFIDGSGNYQSMELDDGTWLDSNNPDWVNESQERWDGNVETKDTGAATLSPPVPIPNDPHVMIERINSDDPAEIRSAKYQNKAGLIILDGNAVLPNGSPVYLPAGTITKNKTFYDAREGVNKKVIDIDIDKLIASGKMPANGVIYVSGTGINNWVRLIDGARLPAGGLTVASDNPIYIKGDYNTINKQPASIASDAAYILSNSWKDANSGKDSSFRRASSTTVNAAILTGNVPTDGADYSGGLENLPRFLEDWADATFTYAGSLIDLWQSEQATGKWHYGTYNGRYYYDAPDRAWAYDMSFQDPAKNPPATPMVNLIQKGMWSEYD